jgi:hypothetical protein
MSVVDDARSALARLSARFCFSDLPDFLLIVFRGDLSAILTPGQLGGLDGPDASILRLAVGSAPRTRQTHCGLAGNDPPAHMR